MSEITINAETLSNTGVPARYVDMRLETWDSDSDSKKNVHELACNFTGNFPEYKGKGTSLVLSGHYRSGKTHIAVGMMAAVIEQGYSAAYMTSNEVVRMVSDARISGNLLEVFEYLCDPDLLVLDNVSVFNEESLPVIRGIIHERYDAKKSICIVTQDSMTFFKDGMGEGIVARLREGGGKCLVFDWKNEGAAK